MVLARLEGHPLGMPCQGIFGKRENVALDRGSDALAAGRFERIVGEHLTAEAHAHAPCRPIQRELEPRESRRVHEDRVSLFPAPCRLR